MDHKLSKTEEKQLEEKIASTDNSSLLTMLNAKNNAANRKTILHRIVIVGKLRSFEDKAALGEYYEKWFKNQNKIEINQKNPNPFQEKCTGILIIYPTLFFHVIESSLETIRSILQDMEEMRANEEEGMIQEAKIITFAHEVHVRLFPVYTFKMMNLKSEHDSNETTETVEQLVSEISTRLLRLGKFLNDNSKNQFKKDLINNLHDQHPEFLPNQNNVGFLLKCNELWSPCEYLDFYRKPFNITLESDLTWPAPVKLFPYQ